MLLNQRQLEILLELFEKPEVYMTASYFSSKHQCSLRTIQNDAKAAREDLTALIFGLDGILVRILRE